MVFWQYRELGQGDHLSSLGEAFNVFEISGSSGLTTVQASFMQRKWLFAAGWPDKRFPVTCPYIWMQGISVPFKFYPLFYYSITSTISPNPADSWHPHLENELQWPKHECKKHHRSSGCQQPPPPTPIALWGRSLIFVMKKVLEVYNLKTHPAQDKANEKHGSMYVEQRLMSNAMNIGIYFCNYLSQTIR